MGIAVSAAETHLLAGMPDPVVALKFRNVITALHAIGPGERWRWGTQTPAGRETAVVLVPSAPIRLQNAGSDPKNVPPGTLVFLHPHRPTALYAGQSGTVVSAWIPWEALGEIETSVRVPSTRIAPSALGRGLHALIVSLLAEPSTQSPLTDYLVEQMLTEMVFGVLVEAAPRVDLVGGHRHAIEKARSLLLTRRADPEYDVEALARDMHMSIRHLQRLFAAEGSTVASELRRARVNLARGLISNPENLVLDIAEIAWLSGFGEAAKMRRAFAWAGLPSPRKLRDAMVR
ncbi:helix-turn-helix domain-containing protein [Microbacterium azadirachtae]|uniref:AraC family transcriptional regulator n=1 Tax=Microbacterium azadirachtae TaxID=582680 RepID=UPI0021D50EA4|nr:helix-turn-helix domain-containing protein [Microbacterium azadirachtae]UXW86763.1 helix-turn-helix domain-containing protein [Microbacterium azadirachtae]